MASCARNICAKNHQSPIIRLKVTIDNVGVPFLITVYLRVLWQCFVCSNSSIWRQLRIQVGFT